jgi:beta-fructofuranosidase
LEIFVNGRTVVTTRVYPKSGKCFGVKPWVVGVGVQMERFDVWGLSAKIEEQSR